MAAGAKTEFIRFERETITRQPGGGFLSEWSVIGEAWANVQWVRGTENERQGAVRSGSVYKFTVYSAAVEVLALSPKDRLVWNSDIYNIRERPARQAPLADVAIVAETGVTH